MNNHSNKIAIQILFEKINKIPKKKKIILEQNYGDDLFFMNRKIPVLKCQIRIVTVSKDKNKARESCTHIARIFSVFDTDKAYFVPKIISYPLVKNSYSILSGVVKRAFPLFSDSFLISVQELASIVHLPVGAESSGLKYSKPTINPANLPW
jgi:hypothetical protein